MVTKKEAQDKVLNFFNKIENKSAEEVRNIKKFAMSFSIRLEGLRKNFCRNCYSPLIPGITSRIRVKNKIKNTECRVCHYVNRWKLESEM